MKRNLQMMQLCPLMTGVQVLRKQMIHLYTSHLTQEMFSLQVQLMGGVSGKVDDRWCSSMTVKPVVR